MKKKYQKMSMEVIHLEEAPHVLTGSIVEVEPDVKVEEFKDGFEHFGDDGFEVTFE